MAKKIELLLVAVILSCLGWSLAFATTFTERGVMSQPVISTSPRVGTASVTSASSTLLNSSPIRRALEIDSDCANSADVAVNFGASAAQYGLHKVIRPCANWRPPEGIAPVFAVQIIATSGTQNIRFVEYY